MKNKIKYLVVITFILMIVVNILANALPINGMNTGVVSDSFPNLFAPAGIAFSIWGIIYLLLGMFSFYQLGIINKNDGVSAKLLNKVGIIFSISSVINSLWIFTWHYQLIPLSMLLMICLLVCLILIVDTILPEKLSTKEKLFVKIPFSIYFGWITVATIANATTLLVSLNWNGFGIPEYIITAIVIIIGTDIALLTMIRNKDSFYGLVIIWAYLGIILKHTTEFQNQYPAVSITAAICIALVIAVEVYLMYLRNLRR